MPPIWPMTVGMAVETTDASSETRNVATNSARVMSRRSDTQATVARNPVSCAPVRLPSSLRVEMIGLRPIRRARALHARETRAYRRGRRLNAQAAAEVALVVLGSGNHTLITVPLPSPSLRAQ